MKKFCWFWLLFVFFLSQYNISFASSVSFYITDAFDSACTGSVSDKCKTGGTAHVVVTSENVNKALELSGSSAQSELSYPIENRKNSLAFSFDLQLKGGVCYTDINAYDSENKKYTIAYINNESKFCTADGRIMSSFSSNSKTRITVVINLEYKRVSVYREETKLVADRYLGSFVPNNISAVGLSVTGKPEVSMLLDNVAVYEGNHPIKSSQVPDEKFNPESIEIEVSDENVGETIFYNRTFDEENMDALYNITASPASNTIERETDLLTGNKYLKIEKKTTDAAFIQMSMSGAGNYVVAEGDFSTKKGVAYSKLFVVRDSDAESMFMNFLVVRNGGKIQLSDGTVVGKISAGVWTKVAIAIDVQRKVYDVYINGERAVQNVQFPNKTITKVTLLRTTQESGNETGELFVDNLKIYEGKEPRELGETDLKHCILPDDNEAPNILGSMKAVHLYSGALYTEGTKSFVANESFTSENGTLYFSGEDLKTLFGEAASFKGENQNAKGFYDIKASALALGYYMQALDTRLILFSKSPLSVTEDALQKINKYLLYDRPTADDILSIFNENNSEQHPRVLMNKDKMDNIRTLCASDERMKEWGDNVIENANKLLTVPVYGYGFHGTSMNDVPEAMSLIMNCGMAWQLTGNDRYAGRAWLEMKKICSLDNWNPKSYLDVGEFSAIIGIGYDWMYDAFTEEQRKFIEESLLSHGVEITYKIYYNIQDSDVYSTWWDNTNNWNAVCNGGSILGAIAILDKYPEVCSSVIANASRGLEYLTSVSYYPEGAWEEGVGYWNYALKYVAYTIMSFESAFGTDFGFLHSPGLEKTGWYALSLTGSTGMNAFGDAATAFSNYPYSMWCASVFEDPELMQARLKEMEYFGYRGETDELLMYTPQYKQDGVALSLDTGVKGMEVVSLREEWYNNGATYLGFHGGPATKNHGHYDIGSYIVDMGGTRMIMDIGAENYSASGYFAKNRYRYYRTRPEGHNMYIINPTDAEDDFGINPQSFAEFDYIRAKDRGAFTILDLSSAYDRDAVSARRGYMLADSRRSAVIRDEIELKDSSQIYWFAHTKADIEIVDNNTAYLTLEGKKVKMTFTTNAEEYELKVMAAEPLDTSPKIAQTNNSAVGIQKLAIILKGSGKIYINARYILADDAAADTPAYDVSLDDWEIPDGEKDVIPYIDMIYADGAEMQNFLPDTTGYITRVPSSVQNVPRITAVSNNENYEVTVIQSESFDTDSIVKVTDKANPNLYRIYRVGFDKLPTFSDVNGMQRFQVLDVTASDVPQPENIPTNVIDEKFTTRWAAEGENQWITLELTKVEIIDQVAVSFMNGMTRVQKYSILVSEDNKNWQKIFEGESSGTTDGYEFVRVYGVPAKYVRFVGYGNSKNGWNSVTQFAALGRKN